MDQEGISPRKLQVFVSYASEDEPLASTLQVAMQNHLDKAKDFAVIWIDQQHLRAGFSLEEGLKWQLDQTDILLVIYTGQQKNSHSFTGIEVGYFMATMARPGGEKRRIVPFYLTSPPDATAGIVGVSFGIEHSSLSLSLNEFQASLLKTVHIEHPIVRFFRELEEERDNCRKEAGLPAMRDDVDTRLTHVRQLLEEIFKLLRRRKEDERQPQKKIIVEVESAEERPGEAEFTPESFELPPSAWVIPDGKDSMSIFGLADGKIRWSQFIKQAKEDEQYGWKDVIERVVLSSLEQVGQLDVDNSQLVMSHNGKDVYRVILSRSIKYYDGRREFHLYLVEVYRRNDFGSENTTRLMKALGFCCRFRFLFFEETSNFSVGNITMMRAPRLRLAARELLREMNLLKGDMAEAKLAEPVAWVAIEATNWSQIAETGHTYQEIEHDMHKAANRILMPGDNELEAGKKDLLAAIKQLTDLFKRINAEMIVTLAAKMIELVRESNTLVDISVGGREAVQRGP